jgi:hypothetical protein
MILEKELVINLIEYIKMKNVLESWRFFEIKPDVAKIISYILQAK